MDGTTFAAVTSIAITDSAAEAEEAAVSAIESVTCSSNRRYQPISSRK